MQCAFGIAACRSAFFHGAKAFLVTDRRAVEQRRRHQAIGLHVLMVGAVATTRVGVKLTVEFKGLADAPGGAEAISAVGGRDVALADALFCLMAPSTRCQSLRIDLDGGLPKFALFQVART